MENQTHEMILEATYASGAQFWSCPTCGRRFVIQWPPNYQRIVLEPGDESISHSGGTGGLRMGQPEVRSSDDAASGEDDHYLAPWSDWLEGKGL